MQMAFRTVVETWRSDVYDFINPKVSLKGTAAGKIVIVTGGGRGIGKGVSQAFAEAGAKIIVITGRTVSDLEETKTAIEKSSPHVKVFAYGLDVSKDEEVHKLFANVKKDAGTPDILINNAGLSEYPNFVPLADTDPFNWWNLWEINVKGSYLCSREFINAVGPSGGTIINTASIGAILFTTGMSAYQMGKLAVVKLTEFTEAEYGAKGIRAFSYHPGGIITNPARQPPAEIAPLFKDTVELAAGTVLYLASERSEYLRGRFILANWDLEELEQRKAEITSKNLFKSGINFVSSLQ